MKILLVFVLTAVTLCVHAQPNLLGKSKAAVKEKMASMPEVKVIKEDTAVNGTPYIVYSDTDGTSLAYYFVNDVCALYMIAYPISNLPKIAAGLNHDFVKVDDSTWTTKDYKYRVRLEVDNNSKMIFTVKFDKL